MLRSDDKIDFRDIVQIAVGLGKIQCRLSQLYAHGQIDAVAEAGAHFLMDGANLAPVPAVGERNPVVVDQIHMIREAEGLQSTVQRRLQLRLRGCFTVLRYTAVDVIISKHVQPSYFLNLLKKLFLSS